MTNQSVNDTYTILQILVPLQVEHPVQFDPTFYYFFFVPYFTDIFHAMITIPPEYVFKVVDFKRRKNNRIDNETTQLLGPMIYYVFGFGAVGYIFGLIRMQIDCYGYGFEADGEYYFFQARVGSTVIEWIILLCTSISTRYNTNYLLNIEFGFVLFVISISCCIFFSQCFVCFMPDLRLPNNIAMHSKFGYAYLGHVNELKRIIIPPDFQDKCKYNHSICSGFEKINFWDEKYDANKEKDTYDLYMINLSQPVDNEKLRKEKEQIEGKIKQEREKGWNTCAMYALANKQYTTVEWLEKNGAKLHKELSIVKFDLARKKISQSFR